MYKVEIFKKNHLIKGANWYWQVVADNGRLIGKSTEGYKNKQDCIANARTLAKCLWYSDNYVV